MEKEVKNRLRAVVSLENLSNLEIADKTGYTPNMVSKSLNPKYDVLTPKFLNKFFDGFPDVKKKYRSWVVDGVGLAPIENTTTDNLFSSNPQNEILLKENQALKETINEFRSEVRWLRSMLERAFQLHPELEKQLLSPLAQENNMVFTNTYPVMVNSLGAKQGAFIE
jgi:oligoribonuclease NrnB/cAMP/cGMP phosphodiesterase (DHH superfamily)